MADEILSTGAADAQEPVAEEDMPTFENAFAEEETPVSEESFSEEESIATDEILSTEGADIQEPVEEEGVPAFEDAFAEEVPAPEEASAEEESLAADEILSTEAADAQEPVAEEDISTFDEEIVSKDNEAFSDYTPLSAVESSKNIGYLQWYSGSSEDEMFEIDKNFMSGRFDAEGAKKTIHVNVGYDTYGWNVQFADGTFMSLHDVREYQLRHGKLPCSSGQIIYGKQFFDFSEIERIVVYESVKYFSYGV